MWFAVTGGYTLALLVQAVLGTVAVGFVFMMTREWGGGERPAWIAALLIALTGIVTFYESVLVQAALDPFLTAAALAFLTLGLTRDDARGFGLAGAAFGLEILNRPNVLLAVVVVGLGLVGARRMRGALVVTAGVAVALAPVTIRNVAVAGEWSALSSQGGLNFYVGNNPAANGAIGPVPGISATIEGQQFDARRAAEQAVGRTAPTARCLVISSGAASTGSVRSPRPRPRSSSASSRMSSTPDRSSSISAIRSSPTTPPLCCGCSSSVRGC